MSGIGERLLQRSGDKRLVLGLSLEQLPSRRLALLERDGRSGWRRLFDSWRPADRHAASDTTLPAA